MAKSDTKPDPSSADTVAQRRKVEMSSLARGDLLGGRYRIDRELGRGGMGAVYAAWDSLTETSVAIKVVDGTISELERSRMRDEVKASMRLTHRNIARTHTLDEVDGETFIVMERLEGETLAARIGRGPLPRAEALDVVVQLLIALEVAHDAGIVHRDVKPANLMCCTDGRVVLMDFGIARIEDDSTATHTTSIKGTPAYMAPEVVAGRRADPRADLYAAGLILFEALTGEPPFKATSVAALLFDQLYTELDTGRLDPSMAQVITRATAKDPAARYATAAELRAAVEAPPPVEIAPAIAEASPPGPELRDRELSGTGARDKSPPGRASRRRLVVLVGAAVAVAVAIVVGGWLASRDPTTPAELAPPPSQLITPPANRDLAQQKALVLALMQLESRGCACKDLACVQSLLVEISMIGEDLAQITDPGAGKELDAIGARVERCLTAAGLSGAEAAIVRVRTN